MTNLEKELQKAMEDNMFRSDDRFAASKATYAIALAWIERAYKAGWARCVEHHEIVERTSDNQGKTQLRKAKNWLKENGLS
jgi:hypothetical protein